mmetsp:Transcript_92934/g.266385  ORF Transcript_92934/g.266385 Transcript_92934/m.266385 type:complete len:199 (-) Transcript_92934:103-699(-)
MALRSVVRCLALAAALLGAASAAATEEEASVVDAALAQDDACEAGADGCDLSLRQLRAKEVATEAHLHDHVAAQVPTTAAPAAPAAKCSESDEGIMAKFGGGNSAGSFPKIIANCGHDAYSWFSFRENSMQSCIVQKTGLTSSCAGCFADAGQYGYDSCKMQCLFGTWCSESCLSCTNQIAKSTQDCAGVSTPQVKAC